MLFLQSWSLFENGPGRAKDYRCAWLSSYWVKSEVVLGAFSPLSVQQELGFKPLNVGSETSWMKRVYLCASRGSQLLVLKPASAEGRSAFPVTNQRSSK